MLLKELIRINKDFRLNFFEFFELRKPPENLPKTVSKEPQSAKIGQNYKKLTKTRQNPAKPNRTNQNQPKPTKTSQNQPKYQLLFS